MEWTQFIIFFIGVGGLFIWNRTESRNDIRHLDTQLKANRDLIFEIHLEVKDFHQKLAKQNDDYINHLKIYHKE